jgi:hypothetical protein
MYHWPEGLFVALVLATPIAVAVLWWPDSFVGFLMILGFGMLVGAVLWCGLVVLLIARSTDFSRIDVTVEVIGSLPPAFPEVADTRTVLYRVVTPQAYAGKYGIAGTSKRVDEIEARKGRLFTIRPLGKWRHSLSAGPPLGGSVSGGEDFFDYATPVPRDPGVDASPA